jgi:hypothetical protein
VCSEFMRSLQWGSKLLQATDRVQIKLAHVAVHLSVYVLLCKS